MDLRTLLPEGWASHIWVLLSTDYKSAPSLSFVLGPSRITKPGKDLVVVLEGESPIFSLSILGLKNL